MRTEEGLIIPDSAVRKQTVNFKDSDSLVILGKGDSRMDGLKIARELNCECWGLNDIERYPELTALFELHDYDDRVKKYSPDLPTVGIPVFMKELHSEIPTCIKFPMEGILQEFKIPYFNNQVCLMLAFALQTRRFRNVYMFGIDYAAAERAEQEFERPCTEFWLGVAFGRGVNLFVAQESNMFTYHGYDKGVIYGYSENYSVPIEGFKNQIHHLYSEYLLRHHSPGSWPPGSHDHDHWWEELSKFITQYVHKRLSKWCEENGKMKVEEE